MNPKIRTAVIGVGNMGRHHARVYSEISNLVGIADLSSHVGHQLAKKYGCDFYTDYHKLLNKVHPEAVSIAVPTANHKEITIYCLERKVAALVEKPITANLADAHEMLKKARTSGTSFMVGHVERFNPAIIKLKALIDKKRLGKILNILAIRVGINPPQVPLSDVTLELGIHDIDVANYLLNDFPQNKKIVKNKLFKSNIADYSSIFLEYKNATAIIQTNWITPIKMRKLYVTGSNGFAELDYIQQKLIIYDTIIKIKKDTDYFDLLALSNVPKKEVYISKKEPLKQQLRYFLNNYKKPDYSNAEYSIKALEILTS